MAVQRDQFRAVAAHFPAAVVVVTGTGPDGIHGGMTANAVCSLSLNPLLMLACFDNQSRTLALVRESGVFGLNVLATGQEDRARTFATKHPPAVMFEGIEADHSHGAPVFSDALAWLVCDVTELLPGGDHTIGIGSVRAMGHGDGVPLVWYRGGFGTLSTPESPE